MLIAALSCGARSVLTEMPRQSLDDTISVCATAGVMLARTAVSSAAAVMKLLSCIAISIEPCRGYGLWVYKQRLKARFELGFSSTLLVVLATNADAAFCSRGTEAQLASFPWRGISASSSRATLAPDSDVSG